MSIEKIIQKIETETASDIDKIVKEAQKAANEIKTKYKKELATELNHIRDQGKKRITIMRNIHLSEARRASRRGILSAKEELIEECFTRAKERLRTLSGDEYRRVMTKLIDQSLNLVGNHGVALVTREEDKAILSSYQNITVKPELIPGLGGVILESVDGKIVVDNTFDAILNRQKEDIRTEVAKILYPDEE